MSKDTNKPLLLLLDAHAIIHRAYHALPDFSTRAGVPTGAIFGFASMLLKIIDDFNPDYIVAAYDLPGKTFRHEAFEEYKGTRQKTDDTLTLQFDATRELCEDFGIPIYDAPGFEADDILGTISEQVSPDEADIIIASGDMDTLQLVKDDEVRVYTLKRGLNDTVVYNQDAVEERFGFPPISLIDYKALRGDPSDNIPGIKGIGDKAATNAISYFKNIDNLYAAIEADNTEALKEAGLTDRMIKLIADGKEEAEFSKVLATIRRDAPIDFEFPGQTWRDSMNVDTIMDFFNKYELRALPSRLYASLNLDEPEQVSLETTLDDSELHETSIALWLLDSNMKEATPKDMLEWTGKNTLKEAQEDIFTRLHSQDGSNGVYDHIEQPLIQVVNVMQENGILVDQEFFKKLSLEYHTQLDILESEIQKLAGQEFNVRSPKQLSEILFDVMGLPTKGIKKSAKTGVYSTNIDNLEKLQDQHEIIQKIIEYRELDKLLSTYIDVIPDMVRPDGRLHAQFIQNGTTTGRFSSKDPNMQNIPTRTDLGRKIREGFVAQEGYRLMSFDYSQIELRCLAILSGDEQLTQIFKDGRDIHTAVASLIGGVPEDEVDREMRRRAKIVNFGILYGMGVTSLHKQMGGERAESQKFYDGFFAQFPRASAYLESSKDHAREYGYTETLFGRRRQFDNINSKVPFIRAMAERMALNAPIQGTSADMIKLAMVHSYRHINDNDLLDSIRFALQIHDEIIFEVKEDNVDLCNDHITKVMEGILQSSYKHIETEVPIVVHAESGKNWGELK